MPKERSSIEEMRKKLYMRGQQKVNVIKEHKSLRPVDYDAKSEWDDREEITISMGKSKKRSSFLSILLIISVIFFFVAAGVSSYFIFGGLNVVSSDKIEIQIQGPVTISGGEELSLQIAIRNENNIPLEFVDLLVEYPNGTRSANDISKELPRYRESIGTILPGETIKKTVKSILLGAEDSVQNIKVTIEFRIEGSSAILFAEKEYDIKLTSSPLSLVVSSIDEITSGQTAEFNVTVTSNSSTIVKDALLVAEYPFGFKFISSNPEPSFSEKVWVLGDILPEGKKKINIKGTIVGENEEERVFRFASGVVSQGNEKELGVIFATDLQSIFIKKPFVGINLALNGDVSPEYVSPIGQKIGATVRWVNNMPVRVADLEIEVKLAGSSLDKYSIVARDGFYKSSDNTILFNKLTKNELSSIDPGKSGTVTFDFASLGVSSNNITKNSEIFLDISVRGQRISQDQASEEIVSSLRRTIKLESDLTLASRSVYFIGPFTNTGPLPPKVENETTYTIIWTLMNSSNIVDDTTVTATLPPYVRWLGNVSPKSEDISFNEFNSKVTWNVGNIRPKSDGSGLGEREVAFQVALLPSVSQIKLAPTLVNEQTVTGVDRFTGRNISFKKGVLTTQLSTDPNFSYTLGGVVE